MSEVLTYLAPVAFFAGALALLYVTGRWRPRREAMTLHAIRASWTSRPLSLFLAAWLLVVLAIAILSVKPGPLGMLPLGLAGGILLYCGWQVAGNTQGWADALVQRVWIEQGFRIPYATQQARMFGFGMVLMGGALVALAIAGLL